MKKIYFIVSLAILTIFTACDYNATNFAGLDQLAKPTNLATYTYSLISTDYSSIATTIKKPVTDSVTLMNTQLKAAKNATDSAAINAVIKRLNTKLTTDSTLVAATAIGANKLFINQKQFASCIPLLLNTKYLYADPKSTAMITFNLSADTTKIAAANKFTLKNYDYELMGKATSSQPGYSHDFSATIDPNYYVPIFLKDSFPYAIKSDLKVVRYFYYASSVKTQIATTYIYDGTNWLNYNTTGQTTAKFTLKNGIWQFINSDVFTENFVADLGSFTSINTGTANTGTPLQFTWKTYAGVGYAYGNAYGKGATEVWLVSPEINLTDRVNPILTYQQAFNYVTTSMVIANMAGCYVSTNYVDNPATATWDKMTVTYPPTFTWTWASSGPISLSAYDNKKIRIAFRYDPDSTGDPAWEIETINVLDE